MQNSKWAVEMKSKCQKLPLFPLQSIWNSVKQVDRTDLGINWAVYTKVGLWLENLSQSEVQRVAVSANDKPEYPKITSNDFSIA